MRLTTKIHDEVRDSEIGKALSKLIADAHARGEGISLGGGGNVIQQLWAAFMKGRDV